MFSYKRKILRTQKFLILWLVLMVFLLSACGPNPRQIAETSAAETSIAASPTPLPSKTLRPTLTPTISPVPTETPTPTHIPSAIPTSSPTSIPTITPTPGPFSFYDDFTVNSGGWQDCEGCVWKDGTLVMGPYDPSSYFHDNYCTACGEHYFYRVAVDVTFIEGEVDRFFGIIFADGPNESYYLGISPWGYYTLSRWHWDTEYWENLAQEQSNAVIGSYGTNHIEIVVKPSKTPGYADYYIYINENLISGIYKRSAQLTWVGLAMDYHAQVAAYDNWEYIVLEP
jgi:hypothetical protein